MFELDTTVDSLVQGSKTVFEEAARRAQEWFSAVVVTEAPPSVASERPVALGPLPWQATCEQEQPFESEFRARILALSQRPQEFLVDTAESNAVDITKLSSSAGAVLEADQELRLLRFRLVPKYVGEDAFWRRYFGAVQRVRQEVLATWVAEDKQRGEVHVPPFPECAMSDEERSSAHGHWIPPELPRARGAGGSGRVRSTSSRRSGSARSTNAQQQQQQQGGVFPVSSCLTRSSCSTHEDGDGAEAMVLSGHSVASTLRSPTSPPPTVPAPRRSAPRDVVGGGNSTAAAAARTAPLATGQQQQAQQQQHHHQHHPPHMCGSQGSSCSEAMMAMSPPRAATPMSAGGFATVEAARRAPTAASPQAQQQQAAERETTAVPVGNRAGGQGGPPGPQATAAAACPPTDAASAWHVPGGCAPPLRGSIHAMMAGSWMAAPGGRPLQLPVSCEQLAGLADALEASCHVDGWAELMMSQPPRAAGGPTADGALIPGCGGSKPSTTPSTTAAASPSSATPSLQQARQQGCNGGGSGGSGGAAEGSDVSVAVWDLFDPMATVEGAQRYRLAAGSNPPGVSEQLGGVHRGGFLSNAALTAGSLASVAQAAEFYQEVVAELRWHWSSGRPVPGVPVELPPDFRLCDLQQELMLLNCCIARRHRAAHSARPPPTRSFPRAVPGGGTERREGAVEPALGLYYLRTGEPLYVPDTQDAPVMTLAQVREEHSLYERCGALGDCIKMLLSDMCAFKAANPGAGVDDFGRWYAASGRGEGLGPRHYSPPGCPRWANELWAELWTRARPVPAAKQQPIFDPAHAGEAALDRLAAAPPAAVFAQLLAAAAATQLERAAAWPGLAGAPALQAAHREAVAALQRAAAAAAAVAANDGEPGSGSLSSGSFMRAEDVAHVCRAVAELQSMMVTMVMSHHQQQQHAAAAGGATVPPPQQRRGGGDDADGDADMGFEEVQGLEEDGDWLLL